MEELEIIEKLRSFYKNKNVLLTGHTGFKGSWMLVLLEYLGANVTGYALEPLHEKDLYNAIDGNRLCDSHILDIRDKDNLNRVVNRVQPDIVFHFAAQALVRESYRIPVETFEVNVLGTINVLEAIRNLQKPCVGVMITTDKVYENMEWEFHYKENDRLGGFDPYSSSKAAAEIAIASYQKAYFDQASIRKNYKAIASARGGNVIGGGDWADDRIIPDLVRALQKNEPLYVRNPKAIRPWQHVLELLTGYLILGDKLTENPEKIQGAYNFGPEKGDEMTVEELIKKAIRIWGSGKFLHQSDKENLHEAGILRLQIDKAKDVLNWHPRWASPHAVEKTMSWYKRVFDGMTPIDCCREQINEYFNLK